MDGLKNLWYVTTNNEKLSNLIRMRGVQLDIQTQIDFGLRTKCQECPDTVNEILLLERYWNRTSSRGFRRFPCVELYAESVKDNIEKMDTHQLMLMTILSSNHPETNTCELLKAYIKELHQPPCK